MKKLSMVLVSAAVLWIPTAAEAVIITNVTTNTVLFYDDFEGVSPVSTVAAPDLSDDFDPVAITGSYLLQESQPDFVQVTDFDNATTSGPGAIEGSNYLRLTSGAQETQADVSATPSSGDHINIAFMAYFPAIADHQAVFKVRDGGLGDDTQRAGARSGPGGVVLDLNGDPTTLSYLAGTWQQWEFDYVIDALTYTITIDGVTSDPISNATRGGPGNIQGMGFWNGIGTGQFYMDAVPVPEPSASVLLLTGLACLIRRNRKKSS
jgi:hypothetical protein